MPLAGSSGGESTSDLSWLATAPAPRPLRRPDSVVTESLSAALPPIPPGPPGPEATGGVPPGATPTPRGPLPWLRGPSWSPPRAEGPLPAEPTLFGTCAPPEALLVTALRKPPSRLTSRSSSAARSEVAWHSYSRSCNRWARALPCECSSSTCLSRRSNSLAALAACSSSPRTFAVYECSSCRFSASLAASVFSICLSRASKAACRDASAAAARGEMSTLSDLEGDWCSEDVVPPVAAAGKLEPSGESGREFTNASVSAAATDLASANSLRTSLWRAANLPCPWGCPGQRGCPCGCPAGCRPRLTSPEPAHAAPTPPTAPLVPPVLADMTAARLVTDSSRDSAQSSRVVSRALATSGDLGFEPVKRAAATLAAVALSVAGSPSVEM